MWTWTLPLAIAAVAFAPGLAGQFVQDDRVVILGNRVVTGEIPWWHAFTTTFWGRPFDAPPPAYRPIAILIYRLEWSCFGASPFAFHVGSLLWYLAAVHVAHRVARQWTSVAAACMAASLFACLPVHVENVTSLVGRADIIALLASSSVLLVLFPSGRARPTPMRVATAAMLYLTALLAKESAAPVPAIVFLLAQWGSPRVEHRHHATMALVVVGAAYTVAHGLLLPSTFTNDYVPDDVLAGATWWQRVSVSCWLVLEYVRILAVPSDLCTGRKYAEVCLPQGSELAWSALGMVFVSAIAWQCVHAIRTQRPPWLACALLAWMPFSALLFSPPELIADRFLLAPSFYVCVWVGTILASWPKLVRRTITGVWVVFQSSACMVYATMWYDDLALLTHAVVACPDSVHNHVRLAYEYASRGNPEEAAWHMAVASEGRRHFPHVWSHPAALAEQDTPVEQRLAHAHALLEIDIPEATWRMQLAKYLAGQGLHEAAVLVLPTSH